MNRLAAVAELSTAPGFRPVRVQESANPSASAVGGIAYHHVSDPGVSAADHSPDYDPLLAALENLVAIKKAADE